MSITNDKTSEVVPKPAPANDPPANNPPPNNPPTPPAPPPAHIATRPTAKRWVLRIIGGVVGVVVLIVAIRWLITALSTVSTDDAYVNGHVTFVAPRVPGQVMRVFVDDNNRVHKGDLLVQLDKEPYQVQLNIAQAAVDAAQADLVTAQAQARGLEGQVRSLRFALDRAIEDVDNQIALLRSKVATLNSKRATQTKAQADYDRAVPLLKSGAVSKEDFDTRTEALVVAKGDVEEALQGVYQVRVALGLPPKPESGDDLTDVPPDLDQTFSSVRQAQASLIEAAAQLGYFASFNKSPKQMVSEFYKQNPQGDIDVIYAQLLTKAPPIKQAQAKLAQAERNLDQAKLNLRYCDVVSEIDGMVTRRDVNPGNNVIAGQSIMAVRSLTEIWVDANFKETQLSDLRIGQSADLDVDMYGSRRRFKGRITGFTMGTGSTLALLPAENATGNFVKVVQRLPVRIDLIDYDPDKIPLFIGLSVTPYVHVNEEPSGPDAGKVLQPYLPTAASLTADNSTILIPTTAPGTLP
jgi:membrane fusion protein (multidrug efflux system)